MKKKTLGGMIKDRREFLRLTQRELATKLGVKASHVAYLENGRRGPSLGLLKRISDVLGIKKEDLFLLAHPEAKDLIASNGRSEKPEDAWRQFSADRALQARYQVTSAELRVLKQVNSLGRVSSPRHFLFILNSIRQAVED